MRKKLLSLGCIITFSAAGSAQTILNADFENWDTVSYEDLDSWGTSNAKIVANIGTPNVIKSNTATSGNYAATFTTAVDPHNSKAIPGAIIIGSAENGIPAGGFPFSQLPTTITGTYKYNIMNGDSATIAVFLKKSGTIISQSVFLIGGSQNNFTNFSFNITPPPGGLIPDSAILAIASSDIYINLSAIPGSTITMDNLAFGGPGVTQVIPNGNFENWSTFTAPEKLIGWYDNYYTSIATKTPDAYLGSGFAAKITSYHGSGNLHMTISTENQTYCDPGPCQKTGGSPLIYQKDTLYGYYKYIPVGTDSGSLYLKFRKNGVVTIKKCYFTANNTYTKFSIPYNFSGSPKDTVVFTLNSSKDSHDTTLAGSELYIDHLYLASATNVPVNPNSTLAGTTICSGTSVTYVAEGGIAFVWKDTLGNILSNSSAITVSPVTTKKYYVNVTTNFANIVVDSITVTVNPSPTVGVINNPVICAGSSAVLTATGASSYSWSPGADTTSSITVTPGATTNYTVTSSIGNCSSKAIAKVTVNALPVTKVNSSTVCTGMPATLTASGGVSYSWSPGGATTSSISVSLSVPASYIVTGTSLGCSSTATANITINTYPSIAVTNTTVCSGIPATLTAVGGDTYLWSPGGETTNSITVLPAPGINPYTVNGTVTGCSSSATGAVTVIALPSVMVNSATICSGASATLTASGGVSYVWSPGNSVVSSITSSPTSTTSYTVTGLDVNACGNAAVGTITVNTCLGIEENSISQELLVYPNPSNGAFTISLGTSTTLNAQEISSEEIYLIVNEFGQTVQQFKLTSANRYAVNIENLDNGIYFIVGSNMQKIVVAR